MLGAKPSPSLDSNLGARGRAAAAFVQCNQCQNYEMDEHNLALGEGQAGKEGCCTWPDLQRSAQEPTRVGAEPCRNVVQLLDHFCMTPETSDLRN